MSILFENYMNDMRDEDSVEIPVYEGTVSVEDHPYINAEFIEEMAMIEASLYVADAMLENKRLAGEEVEVLAEATVKEYLTNAINSIKAIVSKILGWFKAIIEKILMLVTSGKKMYTKYGKMLQDKVKKADAIKGFEMDVKPYELDQLASPATTSIYKMMQDSVTTCIKSAIQFSTTKFDDKDSRNAARDGIKDGLKEVTNGLTTIAKSKEKHIEALRGGKKGNIKTIDSSLLNKYLTYIYSYDSCLKDLKKMQADFEKSSKAGIKALENAQKVNSDANGSQASKLVNAIKKCVTTTNNITSAVIMVSREAYKDIFGVLKRLVTYKPSKESFDEFDDLTDGAEEKSLFESAMDLVL